MTNLEKLDIGTFGSTDAAKNLVKILQEYNDERYLAKVSRYLNNINSLVNDAKTLYQSHHKKLKVLIYEGLYKRVLEGGKDLPPIIRSHMQNVAMTQLKKWFPQKLRRLNAGWAYDRMPSIVDISDPKCIQEFENILIKEISISNRISNN